MTAPVAISSVRVDKQVKNILLAKKNEMYLSDIFLPEISVKDDSGIVPQWGDAHMRQYAIERSTHDTNLHYVELENGTDSTYLIKDYDVTHKVPTKLLEQQEDPYDLLSIAGVSAREIVKLNRDIALAEQLTSTTVLTQNTTLSGTSQWSDHTNSTPYTNIEDGIDDVLKATGKRPNSLYLSYEVAKQLRQHPDYINLYSGGKNVPGGIPASAFEQVLKDAHDLENIYIATTVKINSKKGQTTTRAYVFGKDAVLFYRAASPSILEPSFGYSFVNPAKKFKTETWFDEVNRKHYNVEAQLSFDDRILMADAAYLFKNAVA